MADLGPVGGGVASITGNAPPVVKAQSDHGLTDGDRVSIGMPGDAPTSLCFAKCTGFRTDSFAAFDAPDFAAPSHFAIPAAGTPIVKLAATDRAVVVGINTYPSFTSLQGPVSDALYFQRWLLNQAFVPLDQITLITSDNPPQNPIRPTLDRVKGAFEGLANEAVSRDYFYLGRRLYIFLSGHGILPTRSGAPSFNETALLMANAGPITLGNHLGGFSYAEWFRAAGIFDEVILFVDCCRDQKDAVALTPPSMQILTPQRAVAKHFYAAATQMGAQSFEKSFSNPAEVRGVFSFVLMQALQSSSLCDASGVLTGKLLAAQLYKDVPTVQNNQQPDIDYKPEFDIALVRRLSPTKPKVTITFSDAILVGKTAQLIGRNYPTPDASCIVDNKPWTVLLDPSPYILQVPGAPYAKKFFEVDGQQGGQNVSFP
jgi:Caspase domain